MADDSKNKIITIPNILSISRILLIPFIIQKYSIEQDYKTAIILIAISAFTDFLDGKIARGFNMVSDVGKFLDPIADKLNQLCLIICLINRYWFFKYFIVFFVIKELIQGFLGFYFLGKFKYVSQANWYGKVSTFVFYSVMGILVLYINLDLKIATILTAISFAFLVNSLVNYLLFYRKVYKEIKTAKN